jgi:hypothetical protein
MTGTAYVVHEYQNDSVTNNQWPCLATASVYPPSARDKLKEEALGSHRGRKRGEGGDQREVRRLEHWHRENLAWIG